MRVLEIKDLQINSTLDDELIFKIPNLSMDTGDIVKALFSPLKKEKYYYFIEGSKATLYLDGKEHDMMHENSLTSAERNRAIVYVGQEDYFGYFDNIINSLSKNTLNMFPLNDKEKRKEIIHEAEELALDLLHDLYKYKRRYKEKTTPEEKRKYALRILKRKRSKDCSSGQKKLIATVRNLIKAKYIKPSVLVIDEPLNHLDVSNKTQVSNYINDIVNDNKEMISIIISHCLVFPFINNDNCREYEIDEDKVLKEPMSPKKLYSCLEQKYKC